MAPQHPKGAASAAPAARQHRGHPTVPRRLRGEGQGQNRGQSASLYIRPKTPGTVPEDAAGAAVLQNPALGAAPPAWPARGHQEPPVTPWCLKADTPPASGGDPGQEAAHRWNVQPQMPRAGPEDDAGAATHQKTVLGAAAAPDLPGGRHRGPPVDPQGLNGDDAPASRGQPREEAAPHYNIRLQIPRGRPEDGVGADTTLE